MTRQGDLAVYVHWPFCVSKCPYCDFNSHVAGAIDQGRWRATLLAELDTAARGLEGRRLTSLYFGGGTPSLMDPDTAGAVIAAARRLFPPAPDVEITLEANPTTVEADTFGAFAAAGVNRLSLGVQALDDGALKSLGRAHDLAQALAALARARQAVDRVTFDVIYARPGQTIAAWRDELSRALDLGTDHLSLYQLTVEPGTPFFRDGVAEADEDLAADLWDLTQEMTDRAGLPAYEISNHARPGRESRHNLTYWRGGDYLGIGPGAHGRRARPDGGATATHRIHDPGRWLAAVERDGHGTGKVLDLTPAERQEERVMTGLRTAEGLDAAGFRAVASALDPRALADLVDEGFLVRDDRGLRCTPAGRPRLNALLGRLLAG
ncbi:MAG: coproporphyrinogen III oxidase [Rhodobacterales bacterium]|nr:coproporphyrinogen III oxidase [Rhodobacterales bacterium]